MGVEAQAPQAAFHLNLNVNCFTAEKHISPPGLTLKLFVIGITTIFKVYYSSIHKIEVSPKLSSFEAIILGVHLIAPIP